jgi:hypothetical protein
VNLETLQLAAAIMGVNPGGGMIDIRDAFEATASDEDRKRRLLAPCFDDLYQRSLIRTLAPIFSAQLT